MATVRDLHWDDYEPDVEEIEELERPRDAMVDTAKEGLGRGGDLQVLKLPKAELVS
jgi:hypothetical protein